LQLAPSSELLLLSMSPASVVLVSGSVYAQLLPQARAPGQATLRLVTRDFAAAVPGNAELWVAQEPGLDSAAACLAVLAGSAEFERIVEAEAGVRSQPLEAGRMVAPGALEPSAGPGSLAAARAEGLCALHEPAKRPAARAGWLEGLEGALTAFEASEARARAILPEQRRARERGDGETVQARQRELVELAQRKLAQRGRVRLAYELASAQLVASDAARLTDFEQRFAERVSAVLAGAF
jgi:hypothetical protein